jgi:hypothetical protein
MAKQHGILVSNANPTQPIVRAITATDVKEALARGLDDFWAMRRTFYSSV